MDARKRAYGSTSLRAAPRPGHASDAFVALFTFQTAHLIPAAHFASGVCIFASLTPNRGWAERRETFGCVRGTRWAYHDAIRQALARRLASHNAGRSPLGAPPWRFWASGPRFRLLRRPPSYNGGQLPSGSVQRAPRSQVVVPGGRGPGPPE